MKKLLVILICLSIIVSAYAENVKIFIEGIDKQLTDNIVISITVAGYFYLSDNIPHAFQINLTGEDLQGDENAKKIVAKGKIKKLIKGFVNTQKSKHEKSDTWNETFDEDIK